MDANKFAVELGKEAKMPITASKLAPKPAGVKPNALRGNMGDVFKGPQGRGLVPEAPAPAVAPLGKPQAPAPAKATYKVGAAPISTLPPAPPPSPAATPPVGPSVKPNPFQRPTPSVQAPAAAAPAAPAPAPQQPPTSIQPPAPSQDLLQPVTPQKRTLTDLFNEDQARAQEAAAPLQRYNAAIGTPTPESRARLEAARGPKPYVPQGVPGGNPFAPPSPRTPSGNPFNPADLAKQSAVSGGANASIPGAVGFPTPSTLPLPPLPPQAKQPLTPGQRFAAQALGHTIGAGVPMAVGAGIGALGGGARGAMRGAGAGAGFLAGSHLGNYLGGGGALGTLLGGTLGAGAGYLGTRMLTPEEEETKKAAAPMVSPAVHTPAPIPSPKLQAPTPAPTPVPMPKIEAPMPPPTPSGSVAAGPVNVNTPGMLDNASGQQDWMTRTRIMGLDGSYPRAGELLQHPTVMPGLVGAGIGGLYGALFPGEDEDGEQKSRIGSGLGGAAMGGALGAGLGATGIPQRAFGDLMPKMGSDAKDTDNQKAKTPEELPAPGPVDAQAGASSVGAKHILTALEYNRRNSPGHYWWNPFVRGPVDAMREKNRQRGNAAAASSWGGLAGVTAGGILGAALGGVGGEALAPGLGDSLGDVGATLGSMGASEVLGKDDVVKRVHDRHQKYVAPFKAAAVGPFDAELAAEVGNADEHIAAMEHNRAMHPWHYYLNPVVPGPLSNLLTRYGRRINAGMHKSWPLTLAALPTLGIAPAIAGGDEAQNAARGTLKQMETEMAAEDAAAAAPVEAKKVAAFIGELFAEKRAILDTTLIGGALGAAQAPAGKRLKGFGRGAIRGAGTGAGMLGGMALASPLVASLHRGGGHGSPERLAALAALIGSAGLGGYLGYDITGEVLGPPSWEKEEKPVKAATFAAKLGTSLNPMFEGDEKRPEMRLQRKQIKPWREDGNAALDGIAERFQYKKQKK